MGSSSWYRRSGCHDGRPIPICGNDSWSHLKLELEGSIKLRESFRNWRLVQSRDWLSQSGGAFP